MGKIIIEVKNKQEYMELLTYIEKNFPGAMWLDGTLPTKYDIYNVFGYSIDTPFSISINSLFHLSYDTASIKEIQTSYEYDHPPKMYHYEKGARLYYDVESMSIRYIYSTSTLNRSNESLEIV